MLFFFKFLYFAYLHDQEKNTEHTTNTKQKISHFNDKVNTIGYEIAQCVLRRFRAIP